MSAVRFGFLDFFRFLSRFKAQPKSVEVDPPEPAPVEAPEPTFVWVDLRAEKRTKSRGKPHGHRDWSQVTGITLHQTAVNFGTDPMRLLNVPVHGATLEDGTIVRLQPPTAYMCHANGFNKRDIGIEVSCRACGIYDDPETIKNEGKWTLWLPSSIRARIEAGRTTEAEHISEATDIQLEATKELVRFYVDEVAANGGEVKYIHAHRQATKNRVSDPGSRIWLAVGEWAREELGLEVGPADFAISDGKALPDAWTGRANGIRYNWRVDGRIESE